MQLPQSNKLPVNLLSACFNKTTATYKYYWFISILQEIEKGKSQIEKKDLFARMISNAWYTVNYFHISFGQHDLIQNTVEYFKEAEHIPIDQKQERVILILTNTKNKTSIQKLRHFDKNVPHWFLSPWFPKKSKADIYRASKAMGNGCLYALYPDVIEINPDWLPYLRANIRLLKDFSYWNLSLFLQSRNPNVPDIPNKLIKHAKRNSLTKQRRKFWDIVFHEVKTLPCIYTGEPLSIGNYDVEHFIPYSFVSHDLIWNLIPAESSFNSIKSNKLPPLDKYFDGFYNMQKLAIEIVTKQDPKNKFLEDYLTLFPAVNDSLNKTNFRDRIQPLVTIAANNGFEYML